MALKKARLISKQNLTHDVIELIFESEEVFDFIAGQFITIRIQDEQTIPCFRAYSLASSPVEGGKTFALCLKVVPNGRASNWLNQIEKGQEIILLGPNGHFVFQPENTNKHLFIATGTGVAPFRSIIENQLNNGSKDKLELIFGVRYIQDIFYKQLFHNLQKENENFNCHIAVSQPEEESYSGHRGRVTALLQDKEIAPDTNIYICGLKDMINSVIEILESKGVPTERIFFEKYD